jgi:hypothetical protein
MFLSWSSYLWLFYLQVYHGHEKVLARRWLEGYFDASCISLLVLNILKYCMHCIEIMLVLVSFCVYHSVH